MAGRRPIKDTAPSSRGRLKPPAQHVNIFSNLNVILDYKSNFTRSVCAPVGAELQLNGYRKYRTPFPIAKKANMPITAKR
jgi:hypothetical protein